MVLPVQLILRIWFKELKTLEYSGAWMKKKKPIPMKRLLLLMCLSCTQIKAVYSLVTVFVVSI
jgi:hypothetical protein